LKVDFEAYVAQAVPLLGLPIAPEHLPGVVAYLDLAARIAQRVTDFPLEPADESGNTFVPVSPDDLPAPVPTAAGRGDLA
jgi:hypothetical protein